mgnify:CR=1 FL=1
MKLQVNQSVTETQAQAIAEAFATEFEESVKVLGDDATPIAQARPNPESPPETNDDLGPTAREEALREEIAEIKSGGPQRYKEQLPEEGKHFVRDRLDLWFGDGFHFEDGKFAAFDADDQLPADGLITGAAEFEGRDLHFMANDYTVKRGSMAEKGVEKFLRMQQRALDTGRPVLYLMDSSGGRIDQQTGFFANREGIGKYYYNHSMLSGRVPQICVLYGPCIAGAAYTPVFADFTVMVRDMSAMAIASPRMVEMVTGEDISLDDLGGPEVHATHTGSADLVAADEAEARDLVELAETNDLILRVGHQERFVFDAMGLFDNALPTLERLHAESGWERHDPPPMLRRMVEAGTLGVESGEYVLATVHRASNTDDPDRLAAILDALAADPREVVFPAHPRTINRMREYEMLEDAREQLTLVDPVGYLDFVRLQDCADAVATDSGGVQKEAFYLDTRCVTLRDETEWVETVESGWNELVGADAGAIRAALRRTDDLPEKPALYGGGRAAERVVDEIVARLR